MSFGISADDKEQRNSLRDADTIYALASQVGYGTRLDRGCEVDTCPGK